MKKVRVALIGHGHLGRWHAQKAHQIEKSELVAIVEPNREAWSTIQSEYPHAQVVASIDEVMGQIDAAIIATPTSLHANLLAKLLENKKHVFCEKPVVANASELTLVDPFIDQSVLENKLIVQVGHSERCHEAWSFLENYQDDINNFKMVKMNRLGAFKGRATDVDVVADLMIHDIDLMLWIFKQRPITVSAIGEKMRTGLWDYACAEFKFPDLRKVVLTVGRNHTHEVRDFELVSKAGTLRVDLLNQKFGYAASQESDPEKFVLERDYQRRDHLLLEQESFYNSILEQKAPMVSYGDGAIAVKYLDCVLEALNSPTNQEVRLP